MFDSHKLKKQVALVYTKAAMRGKKPGLGAGLGLFWALLTGVLLQPVIAAELDLSGVAQQAQQQQLPILLYLSRSDCGYCARLSSEVLEPMRVNQQFAGKAVFVEVVLDQDQVLAFHGQRTTAADFAKQRGTEVTPALYFLDAAGQPLLEPVIGLPNLDYFGYELRELLQQAATKLKPE